MNEDSLPAMPGWDNATTRKIEDHDAREDEAVEMAKLDQQTQPMLPHEQTYGRDHGDLGVPQSYDVHRGYSQNQNPYTYNPVSAPSPTVSPVYGQQQNYPSYPSQATNYASQTTTYPSQTTDYANGYGSYNRIPGHENPISPSVYSSFGDREYAPRAPPSYHSRAPSQGLGRKPVHGSWREI